MDRNILAAYESAGLVRKQKHPVLPLEIFNYAERVQYDRLWDDVTKQCRGLVMCGEQVVARPFAKFFNDTEHKSKEIPWHLPCEVSEKMDGSLLIYFNFCGQWVAATRGSFVSEQAAEGQAIIDEHYGHVPFVLGYTHLFEVVYPENRIVVDYGTTRDVVLLAIIETKTGYEVPRKNWHYECRHVKALPPTANFKDLRSLIQDDQEGYVLRFSNGFRMKVKGERYLQLHKLYSGISSRMVWEHLSGNIPLADVLAIVPDEFADWLRTERSSLLAEFDHMSHRVERAYSEAKHLGTRKEQALMICDQHADIKGAVFAALDGKPVEQLIWKQLYPDYRRPTKVAAMMEA